MLKFRKIFSEIWENIDNDLILLLNGARQVGKTSLMKMVKEKLISEKNISSEQILWFDLEQTKDLTIWSSQTMAISSLPKDSSQKYYLFIDEFQSAAKIGSILKVIHDHHPHIKIIITGSASWYIDIDESMAGRKRVIKIWPLDFSEFLNWQSQDNNNVEKFYNNTIKNINSVSKDAIKIINEQFSLFASWGGYPKIVLTDDKKQKIYALEELIDSYLTRDIKIWNYSANTLEVKKLLTLLASLAGNTLSVELLSVNSGLGRTQLLNRLELLKNTFILHLVQPYFTNKIKEITKAPKIYLVDSGLRNTLLNTFSVPEQTSAFGHLAENVVAVELLKNSGVLEQTYFWRTVRKQEVDIILKRENNLIPIEIKAGNETSIPSGLRYFIRQYNSKEAYVLNWSVVKDEKYNNCNIHFRPLWFAGQI